MAVPNTSTFSLQDVMTERGLGAGNGLVECFLASPGSRGFAPSFKGNKDRLSNFRAYNRAYYY